MPGCKVDSEASPQFKALCSQWRRQYPHIDSDLKEAFEAIAQNILANKARRVQAGTNVEVYKYRQNSSDIRRGQRYGWRIYALYDKANGKMYPIIVYPKTAWEDADTQTILDGIKGIRTILGHCTSLECDGRMKPVEPPETAIFQEALHVKTQCEKCRGVHWKPQDDVGTSTAT